MATISKRRGFQNDAVSDDFSGLPPMEGWLRKMNSRGQWQSRYFKVCNGFLNYHDSDKKMDKLLASIDLSTVAAVNLANSDWIELRFQDGRTYTLRAKSREKSQDWIELLDERRLWAQRHVQALAEAEKAVLKSPQFRSARNLSLSEEDVTSFPLREPSVSRVISETSSDKHSHEEIPHHRRSVSNASTSIQADRRESSASTNVFEANVAAIPAHSATASKLDQLDAFCTERKSRFEQKAFSQDSENVSDDNTSVQDKPQVDSDEENNIPQPPFSYTSTSHDRQTRRAFDAGHGSRRGSLVKNSDCACGPSQSMPARSSFDGPASRRSSYVSEDSQPTAEGVRRVQSAADNSGQRPRGAARTEKMSAGHSARHAEDFSLENEPPSFAGYLQKRSASRFKGWEKRYMRLTDKTLAYYVSETSHECRSSIPINSIQGVQPKIKSKNGVQVPCADFSVTALGHQVFQFRAPSPTLAKDWIMHIQNAIAWRKQIENAIAHNHPNQVTPKSPDDASYDSDASDTFPSCSQVSSPPPDWMRTFDKSDDQARNDQSVMMLNKIFEPVHEQSSKRGKTKQLSAAVNAATASLEDRCMECRARRRPDIVEHYVMLFDARMLQEVTCVLDTGAHTLSSSEVLAMIDSIEAYCVTRRRALKNVTAPDISDTAVHALLQTGQDLVQAYINKLRPEIEQNRKNIVQRLTKIPDQKLFNISYGIHLNTIIPRLYFDLVFGRLEVARKGGSVRLQRMAISTILSDTIALAADLLARALEEQDLPLEQYNPELVIALTNDIGLIIDHVEYVEQEFIASISSETDQLISVSRHSSLDSGFLSLENDMETDRNELSSILCESEEAKRLQDIAQDLPRTITELMRCGRQMLQILLHAIAKDMIRIYKEDILSLGWDAAKLPCDVEKNEDTTEKLPFPSLLATFDDYMEEYSEKIDPGFFPLLAVLEGQNIVLYFIQWLVKVTRPQRIKRLGGHVKVLTQSRINIIVAITHNIEEALACWIKREDRKMICAPLENVRQLLLNELDCLGPAARAGALYSREHAIQYALLFEQIVRGREDLDDPSLQHCIEGVIIEAQQYALTDGIFAVAESQQREFELQSTDVNGKHTIKLAELNNFAEHFDRDLAFSFICHMIFQEEKDRINDILSRSTEILRTDVGALQQTLQAQTTETSIWSKMFKKKSSTKSVKQSVSRSNSSNARQAQPFSPEQSRGDLDDAVKSIHFSSFVTPDGQTEHRISIDEHTPHVSDEWPSVPDMVEPESEVVPPAVPSTAPSGNTGNNHIDNILKQVNQLEQGATKKDDDFLMHGMSQRNVHAQRRRRTSQTKTSGNPFTQRTQRTKPKRVFDADEDEDDNAFPSIDSLQAGARGKRR